ncbi:protein NRT1/ PTR FAMILY 6.2-like [Primulina tabacum]|uniref:protein NRT1/ PTR FAMILY 6.2-like n=1 Tax=Primulina tabacum TaxID=48773 RepID=UPI003F590330
MVQSASDDAVDYNGDPANRSTTGGWVSAASILVVELCERLSSMAIGVNLVTYIHGTMHLPSATASTIVTNWGGFSFLLSIFGGILADTFLGRYWTIAIFANIHALGSGLLAISTVLPHLRPPPCNISLSNDCKEANGLQMAVFYIAAYTVALGLGGIKCSVSGFGADQFDQKDEKEKAQMVHFFNRFYFFISFGTLLAVTVFVYIQDKAARVWGYGSITVLMWLAVVIFLSGTRRYRYKKCVGSPVVQTLQVLVAAIRKRNLTFPSNVQQLYHTYSEDSRYSQNGRFSFLDKASIVDEADTANVESGVQNSWRLCSVAKVEEIKMMSRLLPIWATTIMLWTVHAQMITYSVLQAATLKRSIGSFQIPPGSFNAFFIGAILLSLGIYDRLVIHLFKKESGNKGLTNLQKIGLGLFFSVIAMGVAAIVEIRRMKVAKSTGGAVLTLPMSGFFLVPQFALAGVAEGFVYTGQLDFFLSESPKGMKAISTSLFLTTIAFGFFVSTALVSIIRDVTKDKHNWLPADVNNGRLDLFYGFIALLCAINLVIFICCARWFIRKKALTSN